MRSFAAPTGLVRLPEEVLADTRDAVLSLRSAGYVSTLGSFVADAIRDRLARLHAGQLGPDQLSPQNLVTKVFSASYALG